MIDTPHSIQIYTSFKHRIFGIAYDSSRRHGNEHGLAWQVYGDWHGWILRFSYYKFRTTDSALVVKFEGLIQAVMDVHMASSPPWRRLEYQLMIP